MTCGAEAHTAVKENCGFTKPEMSNTKRTGRVHTSPLKNFSPKSEAEWHEDENIMTLRKPRQPFTSILRKLRSTEDTINRAAEDGDRTF